MNRSICFPKVLLLFFFINFSSLKETIQELFSMVFHACILEAGDTSQPKFLHQGWFLLAWNEMVGSPVAIEADLGSFCFFGHIFETILILEISFEDMNTFFLSGKESIFLWSEDLKIHLSIENYIGKN